LAQETFRTSRTGHVSQLRHLLGRSDAIVARAPGYVLDVARGVVDVEVAEDLIEHALRCADVAERARRTREALDDRFQGMRDGEQERGRP